MYPLILKSWAQTPEPQNLKLLKPELSSPRPKQTDSHMHDRSWITCVIMSLSLLSCKYACSSTQTQSHLNPYHWGLWTVGSRCGLAYRYGLQCPTLLSLSKPASSSQILCSPTAYTAPTVESIARTKYFLVLSLSTVLSETISLLG